MNYGKRSTSKKRNALISRTSMLEKRAHVSFIRVLFTALIAVCVMVVCLGIGSFRGVIAGAPDVNNVDISPLGYATFLYDDQGTQIRQLSAPTSNRLPVSLDQIPVSLQHAVVAIEDERFYEHNGIDVRGIARAGMKAITTGNFSEGASTITQQLVKNMYYNQNKTLARKAAEAWTALYVERQLSKEEILELYINTIYFGDGYYGLKEASLGYFGKEPQELTDSEAVLLAGIPNAPSAYAPSRHADLALQREKQVLAAMVKYGYLEQSETDSLLWDAAADPVLAR